MLKINLLSFLILVMLTLSGTAKTTINLHFPVAFGHEAIVWGYEDLISYREKIIEKKAFSSKNSVSFVINNSEIVPIRFQVEFFRIDLYIEPNKTYEIEVEQVDFSNRDFYPKNILGYLTPAYKIIAPEKNELNHELDVCNQVFADFFDTNYIYLYQSRMPEVVLRNFSLKMDSLKKTLSTEFARKHVDLQMTQLQMMTRQTGPQLIVDQYFIPSKVRYNDKVYMDFFNSFWSKYLLVSLKGIPFGVLDSVINTGSYNSLVRLVEHDPLLKNAQIREMVILRNIGQMYSNYRFSESALNDILSDIANKGVTPENKQIATNIRKQFLEYKNGLAPSFQLPDFEGTIHKLEDFEGKYIYLSFWNEECGQCLAEMDVMKELFFDFDDIIQFVSVYVGPNPEAAKQLIKSREYKWLQLDYDHNFVMLKDYKLDLFPYFILINKTGQIEWFPSASPSEGFGSQFIKMLNDKKGNIK